jgi:type I restriction enzyme S subunit
MSENLCRNLKYRKLADFSEEQKEKFNGDQTTPILSITKYDGFVRSLAYFKKQVFSRDLTGYKLVKRGEFAYATIHLDEGSIALLEDHELGLISPMYTVFRTDETICNRFLIYLLKSQQYIKKYHALGQGSIDRRMAIPFAVLSEIEIPILPFNQQQKIAEILTSVDEVIENTQSQINKLEDLKKATMNELLTKGIGHTEFKETEIGRIPKSWSAKKLSSVCLIIKDGTHFSPKSKEGPFKYITSKNIKNGELDLRDVSYISAEEHREIYKKCPVKEGDILLTKDGANTGNLAINNLKEQFSLLSSVAIIRPQEQLLLNTFLYESLHSLSSSKQIYDMISGNAITRLTLEKINELIVPIPPLEEQKKISSSLLSLTYLMKATEKKVHAYRHLRNSLMQDLLTGKVRVRVN